MIYFIKTKGITPQYLKIGFTKKSLEGRLLQLQTGCPFDLELVTTRKGTMNDEKEIQRRVSSFRVRGEWFTDSFELRDILGIVQDVNMDEGYQLSDNQKKVIEYFTKNPDCSYLAQEFYDNLGLNEYEVTSIPPKDRNFFLLRLSYALVNDFFEFFKSSPYLGVRPIIIGQPKKITHLTQTSQ